MDAHAQRVAHVAEKIRDFHSKRIPFRIYHGSTNSTRPTVRQRGSTIDVSSLNHVLAIDTSSRVAIVEPNVPMDELVRATLQHNLVPPVVPEFPGITVGGGYAGTAGESSSFKYGFLDAIIDRIEIVLGDGRVLEADDIDSPDLFYGAAGTLGTLGVLTKLHVRLIEAKAFVKVTYNSVRSFAQAIEKIENVIQLEIQNDFVDGILFGAERGVIITGRLTDDASGQTITRFTRRRDPWFYLHVDRISKRADEKPVTECIPLVDYLFRYDRGGFWVGRFAFDYFHLPFSRILRYIFDRYLHTRTMYHALHESGLSTQFVIEDLATPLPNSLSFLEYLDTKFKLYPLWLCPLKFGPVGIAPKYMAPKDHPMLLNVGLWGPGPKKFDDYVRINRELELKVAELKGTKWLYAQMFYTEDEFWKIYDRKSYDELRARHSASQLPSVFDKVKHSDVPREPKGKLEKWKREVISFWVFPGLYGLWKARGANEKAKYSSRDSKPSSAW